LPEPTIDLIRRSLKGEQFVPANDAFEIVGSRAHGHVQVVQRVMQRLDFASLIGSKACICNLRFLLIELLSKIMEESNHVILGLSNDWGLPV